MAHIPSWCEVCKGSMPIFFCKTEKHFICGHACEAFCHKSAHDWRDMTDEEKEHSKASRVSDADDISNCSYCLSG